SSAASSEAREVVKLGRDLVDRIRVFAGHLDKLGNSLGQSVNHYNKAVSSLESRLITKAKEFASLDADKLETPTLVAGDSAQVREFRSPEVTSDPKNGSD
ncbi:MAG: DNA recombination protein RmuC, partial [Trueperella sp.]|nr:DNA recombination protein RmuC [Trueperella sp.]